MTASPARTSNVIPLHPGAGRRLGRGEPFGVLDIGTTKMCCLIARQRGQRGIELQGAGHQLAEGLRAGEIVDVEAVEASILAVIHEAEQQAGLTLREVVLGVAAGRPRSRRVAVDLDLGGRAVAAGDLARALAQAMAGARLDGIEVLHALPIAVTLDGGQPLKEPRGMIGRALRVVVHLVEVAAAPLHNLVAAVERCHLDVMGVVAAPYAVGLASLSAEEMELGALVLDLGGGITGVARFADGRLQEVHTVPLGGGHVTQDLAFGLSIGRAEAERLKTLYGSALVSAAEARERLELPGLDDLPGLGSQIISRAKLTEIIRPRVEEILQLVNARLAGQARMLTGRRLILTGGGSQLEGMVELAEEVFHMPARLGRPRHAFARPALDDLTAATTAMGILAWAGRDDGGLTYRSQRPGAPITDRLARLGQWLRENF